VPKFADWWTLDLVRRTGMLRRITVAHADPSKERAARALKEYPPDPHGADPRTHVLRTGEANVERDVTDARLVAAARDADHLAIMRSLGCRSSMAVPLKRRKRVIGLMTFVTAESGRRYDETHLPAALAFARHAGFALGNALAYGRARRALSLPVPSSRRPGSTSR
jgi:GAF domain-containing protein